MPLAVLRDVDGWEVVHVDDDNREQACRWGGCVVVLAYFRGEKRKFLGLSGSVHRLLGLDYLGDP